MLDINTLRTTEAKIIMIGSYPAIIQSILDFDFLSGKDKPSVKAIIATGRKFERYFFGQKEVLIPVYPSFAEVPEKTKDEINLFINLSSGRRVLSSTQSALDNLPNVLGGAVFAEGVPEEHALELSNSLSSQTSPQPSPERRGSTPFLVGPASIGLLIPKVLKLGAIGGVDMRQLVDAHLFEPGDVAVLSASGGMTNEIINTVVGFGKGISFSLSFGGERFPMTTPKDAFLAAETDPQTKTIVYFGELGGTDEYGIAELLKSGQVTKEVICYVAGTIAEMFETPPQFGHAKALASKHEETAKGKREVLRAAGAKVAESYAEFLEMIMKIPPAPFQVKGETSALPPLGKGGAEGGGFESDYATIVDSMQHRQSALITTSIFSQKDGQPELLGKDLLQFAKNNSFASIVGSLFLGNKIKSKEMEEFTDFVLRISVDHGPSVSGAVNTIVTARAGRDLVSSLSAGLLTIGPRFGGAINQAASNWLNGVLQEKNAAEFVEEFASKRQYISGIGHKKYRVDQPDPRVGELKKFVKNLEKKRFTSFALSVEKVTTAKKGNLILNVDGTIACVLLDILSEKEGLTDQELQRLTEIEFFNALFVLARSVGFIAHYLDQKRLDEGLFRLPEDLVTEARIDA